jgi:acetyltransferase-like isoleucine patch superfamily enzyme
MESPQLKQIGIVDVQFGNNVTVVQPANLYGCIIGDDTFIGPFVEIQKSASIGKRCRIQSHSFVCELVDIGDDCFIAHGVMFVNDKFTNGGPACGNKNLWMPTRIGKNVSIGSGSIILPVTICDNVVIGAGAVVTRDVVESGTYVGNPAKKIVNISTDIK